MVNSKKYTILILLCWVTIIAANAQQTQLQLTSAGGEIVYADSYSGSYTIGEGFIETYKTSNNTLTQGFQQSMLITTSVRDKNDNIYINVYPNPFSDQLNIYVAGSYNIQYITIVDLTGREVVRAQLGPVDSGGIFSLPVRQLGSGMFIVQIFSDHQQLLKTHTLIKI